MTLREAMKDATGMIALSFGQGYFFIGEKDEWMELKDYINSERYAWWLRKTPQNPYKPLEELTVLETYETPYYGYYVMQIDPNCGVKTKSHGLHSFWFKHEFDRVYDKVKKDLRSRG